MLTGMASSSIPPADEDLVFICGALRSGTTLLRLMVNDHPALSNPGEMDFLFEAPPMKNGERDMAAYVRELLFNRVFSKLRLELDPRLGYEAQIRDFVRQLRKPGKRLSINIHRHFDRIPGIFQGARYVRLLRDPRDVAKSSIGMGWAGNVYHGVDHWISSERDFERLAAIVEPSRIHALRYEDLLRAPEAELARLCVFMGVPYDRQMLNYPSHTTYGPPDAKFVEQWRRELSAREIALVESKAGDMLAARGYALSGVAPVRPGAADKIRLRFEDRLGCWRHSVRRYGLFLTMLSKVSGRLGWRALDDFARARTAAIDLKYLK